MLFIILTFLLVSCGGHSEQIDFISELSVFEPDIDPVNRVNNIALRTMVAGVSSGIFNSDKRDFGYFEISTSSSRDKPRLDFFGGEDLTKKCFTKTVQSYLSFKILEFTYCVEAKVRMHHNDGGLFISNARVEILDQTAHANFFIDPLYSLDVKFSAFSANEGKSSEEVLEVLEFSVELFLDGPYGFDARSTDKFKIRADNTELGIIQIHSLK